MSWLPLSSLKDLIGMRSVNQAGLDLIKSFEGLRLTAYQDSVGVWTIGYGHTDNVYEDQHITAAEAEKLLEDDLASARQSVETLVHVPLTDNQFAALVSFTFNLGAGHLVGSTLLKLVNRKDYADAAGQFMRWVFAGDHVEHGLQRRREAERHLFLTP